MDHIKYIFRTLRKEHKIFWFYNINQEQSWNTSKAIPSFTNEEQNVLMVQQEQQLLILSEEEDTVILRHSPDPAFLSYLQKLKGFLPQIIEIDLKEPFHWELVSNSLRPLFVPFIMTEEIAGECKMREIELFGAQFELVKCLNDKLFVRQLALENNFEVPYGKVCNNINDLKHTYDLIVSSGYEKSILKIPYGSSGKGIRVFHNRTQFESAFLYIQKRVESFEVLLEAWHPWCNSLNAQIWIGDEDYSILGITEQRVNSDGVYLGTLYTPDVSVEVTEKYLDNMSKLAKILQTLGYRGILGVDSILTNESKGLIPIIEINARFTQVTYLLGLVTKFKTSFKWVESSFFRFESLNDYDFDYVHEWLSTRLQHRKFTIYTFAKSNTGVKTIYRLYVLFYSNQYEEIISSISLSRSVNSISFDKR
ncbi:[BtrI acyl-carrier protein]--L-glutamate ligase [Paenibacillus sp. DS2015]|uniref:ATP-grasp domain-containing protein n=1 Tax=Paenibacillus sp. DS2015 TaxID=3373917 RepID=UPI003D22D52D